MAAIKSDGGSSSYYDIEIPDWLFDKLYERRYSGKCFVRTEELIEITGMGFNEGNIQKALIRLVDMQKGGGKDGNTVDYDCVKIGYYANRISECANRET